MPMQRFLAFSFALCFLYPAPSQTPDEKQATIGYVRAMQNPDGGFRASHTAKTSESSLRATTAALRGLKYFGGQPPNKESCRRFVAQCYDESTGGFMDRPHSAAKPEVATTAVGLMAAVELKMPLETYGPGAVRFLGKQARDFEDLRIAVAGLEAVGQRPNQADSWHQLIEHMRNADGTFGRGDGLARATGGAVVALLRLGVTVEHRDEVVQALKSGQRPDGGFGKEGQTGSDLESGYRVMRALVMLRERPAQPDRLRSFVARCRNPNGGYSVAPAQSASVAATYYAAIILHWLDRLTHEG
jgi:hypothetical protein